MMRRQRELLKRMSPTKKDDKEIKRLAKIVVKSLKTKNKEKKK